MNKVISLLLVFVLAACLDIPDAAIPATMPPLPTGHPHSNGPRSEPLHSDRGSLARAKRRGRVFCGGGVSQSGRYCDHPKPARRMA